MIIFDGVVDPTGHPGRTGTLLVPVGLPGSGKTTAIRRWMAADPDHRVTIGRDDLRTILGCLPVGSPAQESAITVMMDAAVEALLRRGWDVAADATHIQPGALEHWVATAARLGARLEVLDLRGVAVEVCIARDAERAAAGDRHVGEEVIGEMARRYVGENGV